MNIGNLVSHIDLLSMALWLHQPSQKTRTKTKIGTRIVHYMSYIVIFFNLVYFSVGALKSSMSTKSTVVDYLFRFVFVVTHSSDWMVSLLYWRYVHDDVVFLEKDPWSHILTSIIGHQINLLIPLYDLYFDKTIDMPFSDTIHPVLIWSVYQLNLLRTTVAYNVPFPYAAIEALCNERVNGNNNLKPNGLVYVFCCLDIAAFITGLIVFGSVKLIPRYDTKNATKAIEQAILKEEKSIEYYEKDEMPVMPDLVLKNVSKSQEVVKAGILKNVSKSQELAPPGMQLRSRHVTSGR